jgi:hypothetical protein
LMCQARFCCSGALPDLKIFKICFLTCSLGEVGSGCWLLIGWLVGRLVKPAEDP